MKIYLASDHAGFSLKQFLGEHLKDLGHAVEDCGALEMDPLDDYPDFITPAAKKVAKNSNSRSSGVTRGSVCLARTVSVA